AVIAATERRVAGRPGFRQPRRKILRIGPPGERSERAAPDLPRRARLLQPIDEPFLLFRSEDRLRRIGLTEVRHFDVAEANRCRWLTVVVCPSGIEDLEYLLRDQIWKLRAP